MKQHPEHIIVDGITYGTEQLVDYKVVAKMIGLSHRTVESMATRRELPLYKVTDKANRYKVGEILGWVEQRRC